MSEVRRRDLGEQVRAGLAVLKPASVQGSVTRVVGLEAEVRGVRAAIGDLLYIYASGRRIPAEVIAVHDSTLQVAPLADLLGVAPGAPVEHAGDSLQVTVGDDMLGRVLNALGEPIDGGPALAGTRVSVRNSVPHPLERQRIAQPLPLGVRAVDTMLSCGQGQRIGIFAGSGVGKSTLLGMLARGTNADVVVIGLVGERGREVREFLEDDLGEQGRARAITVVATSDEPSLLRLRAAYTATRIAEHFRDQGLNVLLLVDSLTRFAMAQREIGLAAGEPPATRGYPPSVFAELPKLLERAGPGAGGSITALYTVLVEGDDTVADPVADHARSILDGHIVLSRRLASAGHFPTIDVLNSVSRLSGKVTTPDQQSLCAKLRRLLSAADDARDLVEIGAYRPGSNPVVDEALARKDAIESFLQQDISEVADSSESWARLAQVLA